MAKRINSPYDKAYEALANVGGESTQHDPIYDAIKGLESGSTDYSSVYDTISKVGGVDSTKYDQVYDELKKTEEKSELLKYHNQEETDKILAGGSTKPTSSTVLSASQLLDALRKKQYSDPFGDKLDEMINEWNNREKFSYSYESDPLYLMARDNAVKSGDRAMRDTMGRASAMTGGYGNSYAQAVGQQAYDAYLQELNNTAPDFMNAAYERYQDDAAKELQEIALVQQQRENDLSKWQTEYQKELDYANSILSQEQEEAKLAYDVINETNDYNKWLAERDLAAAKEGFAIDENGFVIRDTTGSPISSESYEPIDYERDEKLYQIALEKYMTEGVEGLQGYFKELLESGQVTGDAAYSYIEDFKNDIIETSLFGRVADTKAEDKWTVEKDGGVNWGGGINNNMVVKDNYNGTTYTMKALYEKLVEEGAPEAKAKEAVINLQNKLKEDKN